MDLFAAPVLAVLLLVACAPDPEAGTECGEAFAWQQLSDLCLEEAAERCNGVVIGG